MFPAYTAVYGMIHDTLLDKPKCWVLPPDKVNNIDTTSSTATAVNGILVRVQVELVDGGEGFRLLRYFPRAPNERDASAGHNCN